MSHDIHFVKGENLDEELFYTVAEFEEIEETSPHFIDHALRQKLVEAIGQIDGEFQLDQDDDCWELTFSDYQISIFKNMLSISMSYGDDNLERTLDYIDAFLELGFTGHDPTGPTLYTSDEAATEEPEPATRPEEPESLTEEKVAEATSKIAKGLLKGIGCLVIGGLLVLAAVWIFSVFL